MVVFVQDMYNLAVMLLQTEKHPELMSVIPIIAVYNPDYPQPLPNAYIKYKPACKFIKAGDTMSS